MTQGMYICFAKVMGNARLHHARKEMKARKERNKLTNKKEQTIKEKENKIKRGGRW